MSKFNLKLTHVILYDIPQDSLRRNDFNVTSNYDFSVETVKILEESVKHVLLLRLSDRWRRLYLRHLRISELGRWKIHVLPINHDDSDNISIRHKGNMVLTTKSPQILVRTFFFTTSILTMGSKSIPVKIKRKFFKLHFILLVPMKVRCL